MKKGQTVMEDIEKVMGWLEGLTFDDWRDYHSDSEVSNIAKAALELLKEYSVIKDTISNEIHETAKMFRRTAGNNEIPLKW